MAFMSFFQIFVRPKAVHSSRKVGWLIAAPTVPPLAFFSHFGRRRLWRWPSTRSSAGTEFERTNTVVCARYPGAQAKFPLRGTKASYVYFIGRRCKPTLRDDRVRFFGVDAEVFDGFIDHAAFDLAVLQQ